MGAEVAYNPQMHELIEGTAEPGATVRVRYTGYVQGEKLLYRAKVSYVGFLTFQTSSENCVPS